MGEIPDEEDDTAQHAKTVTQHAQDIPSAPSSPGRAATPIAESAIIAMTTTISCTMRNRGRSGPCSASISRLSNSSFTMMIVEENVSAMAT